MRKSSKILAIVFLIVAGGLVFWSTRKDEAEIQAAVEARVEAATAERERELEALLAQREQALADSLAAREAALQERVAELDSARVRLDDPVYVRLDADIVARILQRMGLEYEQGVDDSNDPKFSFRLATYSVTLYFYGCEAEGCTSLRLYAGFSMDEPPTVEHINEWNRTKRYATAYLRENGGPGLDNDLIIKGGITEGAVEEFIINFRNRLGEYTSHIGF